MSAIDECCYTCRECGELTCYVETCANFQFDADVVRMICAYCAKGEES